MARPAVLGAIALLCLLASTVADWQLQFYDDFSGETINSDYVLLVVLVACVWRVAAVCLTSIGV